MPKSKKQPKEKKQLKENKKPEVKEEKEKIKEIKETSKKTSGKEKAEESGLEEEIKETEDEIQEQNQIRFFPARGKIIAPVLEQISEETPKTPEINLQLSPERGKEKEKEKKSDYLLEQSVPRDYDVGNSSQKITFNPLVLMPERIDISKAGREREPISREFVMQSSAGFQEEKKDYKIMGVERIDISKAGREKEQIAREYKPKNL